MLDEAELSDLSCPLSYRLLEYPVIATDGFTYTSDYLFKWMKEKSTSPLTRAPLVPEQIRENKAVLGFTAAYSYYKNKTINLSVPSELTKYQIYIDTASNKAKFCEIFHSYRNGVDSPDIIMQKMRELIQSEPSNLEYLLIFLNMLRYYKQFEEADLVRKKIFAGNPNLIDLKTYESRLLLDKGDKVEAFKILDQICVEINNMTLLSVLRYSIALLASGREQMAMAYTQAYLDAYPNCQIALGEFIKMQYIKGKFEDAIETGKKALQLYPDDLDAIYYTAQSFAGLNNKSQAQFLLNRIIKEKHDNIFIGWAYLRLGDMRSDAEEFTIKIAEYEFAQKFNPDLKTYRDIARLFMDRGMYKEAYDVMDPVAEQEEDTLFLKAKIYDKLGYKEKAVATYSELAKKYPEWKSESDSRIRAILQAKGQQ